MPPRPVSTIVGVFHEKALLTATGLLPESGTLQGKQDCQNWIFDFPSFCFLTGDM